MNLLEMNHVKKSFDDNTVLKNISFSVKEGEVVSIIGPSGSGKSTLIKLLLKELEPTSGTIKVNGINLNKMKQRAIPKYRRKDLKASTAGRFMRRARN